MLNTLFSGLTPLLILCPLVLGFILRLSRMQAPPFASGVLCFILEIFGFFSALGVITPFDKSLPLLLFLQILILLHTLMSIIKARIIVFSVATTLLLILILNWLYSGLRFSCSFVNPLDRIFLLGCKPHKMFLISQLFVAVINLIVRQHLIL